MEFLSAEDPSADAAHGDADHEVRAFLLGAPEEDAGGRQERRLMWNLADAIRHHARRRPAHPAIVYRGRDITYAEFDALVDSAAAALSANGIGYGDRVGIALADRPEHLAFLFGAARLGAVFVPLDVRWAPSEKERV